MNKLKIVLREKDKTGAIEFSVPVIELTRENPTQTFTVTIKEGYRIDDYMATDVSVKRNGNEFTVSATKKIKGEDEIYLNFFLSEE